MRRRKCAPSSTAVQLGLEPLAEYEGITTGTVVRVKGLHGQYRVGRIYRDKGGVCLELRGVTKGADTSRIVDPARRKVVRIKGAK